MAIQKRQLGVAVGLLVLLLAAYWNHFENSFHFDDSHTIVDNPAIRTLGGIPGFFFDTATFSHEPAARSYRPLITASLAIDYAIGGGLNPFWFHFSTFLWFLVQLALMYALYVNILDRLYPSPQNPWVAWFAVALYGLHPAAAETINYMIQRGDLYVALGIVAGVLAYASIPSGRRFWIYLLPPLAAMFAKPTALVFAPLLLLYIVLVEHFGSRGEPVKDRAPDTRKGAHTPTGKRARGNRINAPESVGDRDPTPNISTRNVLTSVVHSLPAFALCALFSYLEHVMTPPTFFHSSLSAHDYWITQPYVTMRYVRSFFLPFYLSADSGLAAFRSLGDPLAILGVIFCGLLIWAAIFSARVREWRPMSFGLWWFLIGLVPTAVYPLEEVENDHRLFLPFIGFALAVAWALASFARRYIDDFRRLVLPAGILLVALAWGVHIRNEVWHTEETLWRDVTEKSPRDPRGHYNLGHALNRLPGASQEAMIQYEIAVELRPDYTDAQYGLAVLLSKSNHLQDAITHYNIVLGLKPTYALAHFGLGAALARLPDRAIEAIAEYESFLQVEPNNFEARSNLAGLLARIPGRLQEAITQYQTALRINPASAELHNNLGALLVQMLSINKLGAEVRALVSGGGFALAADSAIEIARLGCPNRQLQLAKEAMSGLSVREIRSRANTIKGRGPNRKVGTKRNYNAGTTRVTIQHVTASVDPSVDVVVLKSIIQNILDSTCDAPRVPEMSVACRKEQSA